MIQRILGNSLPNTIHDMQQDINDLGVSPSSYRGDWYEIAEPVVYTSATVITASDSTVDFTKLLQIGTPIRLKQGGAYKYFYVQNLTATTITINGGLDYTLTSATITDFAKGLNQAPIGFPVQFKFDPHFTGANGATYSNPGGAASEKTYFSMLGKVVTLYLSLTDGGLSPADYLLLTPPIPKDNTYYRGPLLAVGPVASWYESSTSYFYIYGTLIAPYKFTTGVGNTNFAAQFSYTASS